MGSRSWIRSGLAGAAACALALACATPTPPELLTARDAVEDARRSDVVQQRASVELYEAEQALERAEQAWVRDEDAEEAVHLSYLTSRKVERARLAAEGRAAAAEAQALTAQRDKVRLEVRTREADHRALEAEQARAEAEAARQTALEATEREAQLRKEIEELQAKQTERGIVLTLGDVLFDVDQATLKPGAMQNLYRLVTFLKEHPDRSVVVEGHTDSTGSEPYNLGLSQRRAEAVEAFLTENGIGPDRLLARGYGQALPVASNASAEGRQLNRRVEVVILEPGVDPASAARVMP